MALHWPTFFTRLGSAIVFAAVMMAGLLWNEWALLVLVTVITILCLREFFRIMKAILPDTEWPSWMPVVTIVCSLVMLWLPPLAGWLKGLPPNISQPQYLPPLLMSLPLVLLGAVLSKKTALVAAFTAMTGLVYITMPALMLYGLRLQSLLLPLALVLLIWMNDTCAYLVGSFIGKTPFSPISPKKTWEGTAGGAILTMVLAGIWGWKSELFDLMDWAVLSVCASVAGTAGDLLESKLKRLAGVKDSGTMMPGHGGALDRFDSLLVATPFVFGYAYLFMKTLPIKPLINLF
jgi:phosphatidate cytidylyltransferase